MRIHYRKFENKVILVAGFILLLAFVFVLYVTIDRQQISRDDILVKSFHDRSLNRLAEGLIQAGAFSLTEEGTIALNNNVLMDVISERYPPAPGWLRRFDEKDRTRAIERDASFIRKHYERIISINHGRFVADPNATKMVFRGNVAGRDIVVRGTIRDRENRILAESTMGPGQKVQRHYPMTGPLWSIVGMDHFVFGKHFIESAADLYLSGDRGGVRLKGTIPFTGILRGADITLTLDAVLQQRCYDLMEANKYKGAAVILAARSGELLAAVSSPSIDGSRLNNEAWRNTVNGDPSDLLANRCFAKLYFPGSIYKVIVASAWLESNQMRTDFTVNCTGRIADHHRIRCTGNHGTIGLARGFTHSCNQTFSEMAVMLGKEVTERARRFGFDGRPQNLLPSMVGSLYAVPSQGIAEGFDFRHNKGLVAQAGIGQNLIKVTPMEAAVMLTPFANQGRVLAPYLIREIRNADGKVLVQPKPVSTHQAVRPKTASQVLELLKKVMTQGTGRDVKKIRFDGFQYTTAPTAKGRLIAVAGKTGTAQVAANIKGHMKEKPHSWFVAIAPADKPEFIIALVLENQGHGAAAAAPLAMDMLTTAFNIKNTGAMKKTAAKY